MENAEQLESLPNVGKTLAVLLREAGILTPAELQKIGALQAFLRIQAVDPDACFSKLCALEGAVEGVRWHGLSHEKKDELKHFFALVKK